MFMPVDPEFESRSSFGPKYRWLPEIEGMDGFRRKRGKSGGTSRGASTVAAAESAGTKTTKAILASAADECDKPPAVEDLSDWTQYDYDLDAKLAAKLGFALGGTNVSGNHRLLIREFARSRVCVAPNGKGYRYGTSVRLMVRVTGFSVGANLSLPIVAGETQVGRMQAESHLRVVGYVGEKLASMLPPFRTFNVDAYAEMSTKMNDIKQLIGQDLANVRPAKLGVDLDTQQEEEIDLNEALGLIWGLARLVRGESCTQAKAKYPDNGSHAAMRAIEAAYQRVPNGSCSDERPTAAQREVARELLRGVQLK